VVPPDGDHRLAQAVQDRLEFPLPGECVAPLRSVQQIVSIHGEKYITRESGKVAAPEPPDFRLTPRGVPINIDVEVKDE